MVFWNLLGLAHPEPRAFGHVVESEQFGWGNIIGTRGPVSGILRPRRTPEQTDPVDHVEGEGRGEFLQPLSLYEDQLRRRLTG